MSKAYVNQIEPKSGDKITTDKYIQQKGLPYFRAGRSSGDVSVNTNVVFNTVFEDNNGDYDSSTGKFTAPIDGTYFFGITALSSATANQRDTISVYKDSTANDILHMRSEGDKAAHNTMSGTLVIELTAGQTIFCRVSDGVIYGGNNKWTQFCGYLIA